MGKLLTCPICNNFAYNIERIGEGEYRIKCMKSGNKSHSRTIKLEDDTLHDLRT